MGIGATTTNQTMPLLSCGLDSSLCIICGKGRESYGSKHTICQWVLSVSEEGEQIKKGTEEQVLLLCFIKGCQERITNKAILEHR